MESSLQNSSSTTSSTVSSSSKDDCVTLVNKLFNSRSSSFESVIIEDLAPEQSSDILGKLRGDPELTLFVSLFFAIDILALHRNAVELTRKERIFILILTQRFKEILTNLEINFSIQDVWDRS